MVRIDLAYEGELRVAATHAPSGRTLTTDAPVDNEGKGESFSPTDLVATALGACMLTIMGIVARRKGIRLEGARASVEKEMSADPRRIARLTVLFRMPAGLPPEHRKLLENAAFTCPVHKSLLPEVETPVAFEYPD